MKRTKQHHQSDQNKSSSSYSVILSVLVIALLTALSYLGYQTYELNKKVSRLESAPTAVASLVTPSQINRTVPQSNSSAVDNWDFDLLNPFEDMKKMHEQINKMFGSSWSRFYDNPQFKDLMDGNGFSPSLDLKENNSEYIVTVNVPGAEKSDINVKVEDNTLIVSGKTKKEASTQDNQGTTLSKERFIGQFSRAITLAEKVDPASIKSDYKDGVLVIHIKKAE